MRWSFPWASSYHSDYNFDLEIFHLEETTRQWLAGGVHPLAAQFAEDCGTEPASYPSESPMLSSYALDSGAIHLTYFATARGLELMMVYSASSTVSRLAVRRESRAGRGCAATTNRAAPAGQPHVN